MEIALQLENKVETTSERFLILANNMRVGIAVLTYSFFGRAFIEIIEINKGEHRKGYGEAAILELCKICKTEKIFTSTNQSNEPMKKLLAKLNFVYAGVVNGLDDGDPEMFFYKELQKL